MRFSAWSSDVCSSDLPTAAVHDLSIISYDAEAPAEAVAERLRRAHATGTVLVVGHSNTVPGIVSALCGCEVAPIDESDYGNMFEVRIRDGAAPVLSQRRYCWRRSRGSPTGTVMSQRRARCRSSSPRRSSCARSEEHTSELQSLMRISSAVFCLKKKKESKQ